ncbi:Retrovirus-related Pol polyprotein from transposon TNT 1-94 [Vitis vinifera]|uniref:Retrovirus-related Pol polyprotein from transposon TNT 1-94 n=1 Tax=Vitis vinifera TaxID=29760 RepID=A0A438I7U4_VITVI|nr:Retrovirus-related Pol polyprotein from transposon TNT 1-94 [Vitis vinifera]
MIVEINTNTNVKTTDFKEEDKVATTQLHINQGQQTSPMWSATDVIEKEEEVSLLMACHANQGTHPNLWYIDTGCSNHMCGDKSAFSDLDETFRNSVTFGDNSKVSVMGKGSVRIHSKEKSDQIISNVFFVPDLKTNLLSVGQLQEKGYEIFIKDGVCRIQDEKLGLIAQVNMTTNRMFPLYLDNTTQNCFSTKLMDEGWLWHFRYGHLNFGGLKTLQQKNMVTGLPPIQTPSQICEECVVGKQHRYQFPKGKSWRANKVLELVHSDICGPINPTSNGVIWSIHILNRSPTLVVQNVTPEEAWNGRKPSVNHFRIFGCIAYAHIPDQKRKKLDDKGEKCIFLGVSEVSKAYKLYNPITKKIFISRDIIFDEGSFWKWDDNTTKQQIQANFDGENEEERQQPLQQQIPVAEIPPNEAPTTAETSPTTPEFDEQVEAVVGASSHRVRKWPAWMSDYEVTGIDQSEDPLTHFALFSDCDPTTFESAVKESKWRKAMDAEIAAIERNDTWELSELPKGHKTIGVKWVYKTKLKENGEVDKYKARLVAKGYKQEFGVDYKEVFAPVARHDTIRLVIALAAQNSWPIFQLDVKSAFLHGNLEDSVMFERFKKSMMLNLKCLILVSDEGLNPVSTPTQFGLKLNKDHGGKKVDSIIYKQIVGSLMYLTATRPDIMHSVSLISRYMENPTELHFLAAKKICRYLQGTKDFGLFYKKGKRSDLIGFTDSDYAGDQDNRRSTSGYVFMLGTGAVSWSSKKQPIVTLSTTEAEFVAAQLVPVKLSG